MSTSTPDARRPAPTPATFLVGHRALSPELAATYHAAGVTFYELDVRVVDRRVIATHYRPVRWSRGVLERDNAALRVRARPPRDTPADDIIRSLPPGARIVFDPKDREPRLRAQLAQALAAMVDEPGRHVVSTRDRDDLEIFGDAGFRTWWTLDTPEQIARVVGGTLPADGVTVRQRSLTADSVRSLHTVTDTVVAWTARSVARAQELVSFGVDGITTHDLEVMQAVTR